MLDYNENTIGENEKNFSLSTIRLSKKRDKSFQNEQKFFSS